MSWRVILFFRHSQPIEIVRGIDAPLPFRCRDFSVAQEFGEPGPSLRFSERKFPRFGFGLGLGPEPISFITRTNSASLGGG
jgi:hypothetical protein